MKFLQHGDSVVSLRFVYQEAPNLTIERNERVISDTDRATAMGKLEEVAILLDQYSEGVTSFGSEPEDLAGVGNLIAYFNQYLRDDLNSTELSMLERVEGSFGALAGEVPSYLTSNDYLPPIDEILPGVGTSEELSNLQIEVKHNYEHFHAGSESVEARMALLEELRESTQEGLKRELERPATPDQPVVRVASRAQELPDNLQAALDTLETDASQQLGMTPETLASAMLSAEAMEA